MARKRDLAADDLTKLKDDLKTLYVTLTTDPKKQKRKERAWGLLYGALSAGFALAGRRLLYRGWGILTGEAPPVLPRRAQAQPPAPPSAAPTGVGTSGTSATPADQAAAEGTASSTISGR